jgi:hypothetical protein
MCAFVPVISSSLVCIKQMKNTNHNIPH